MKNTIVVNLFGGQGTGKSTIMAGIFSKLKFMGYDCEMCPEFAKELVWENRMETFSDELYLFAKQNHRLFRLNGKVDVVITDRPLYMSIPYYRYYKGENETYEKLVKETFDSYNNFNIFLIRKKPFNPNGRNETEEQSREFDKMFKQYLDKDGYEYVTIDGVEESIEKICGMIVKLVDDQKKDNLIPVLVDTFSYDEAFGTYQRVRCNDYTKNYEPMRLTPQQIKEFIDKGINLKFE